MAVDATQLVKTLAEVVEAYGEASAVGAQAAQALTLAGSLQDSRSASLERLISTCKKLAPMLSAEDRKKLKAAALAVVEGSRGFTNALERSLEPR